MKILLYIAAVLALASAKPGTYKENEDFQYSRSSTDEGSKSGFYGAQRGNMGGNFERAHNMDGLAQHQMNTAVKQVEGELGDVANMKSGDVFTSANSGGMFGSGHYDISNLQGRNFQESSSSYGAGESQSHSSLSSHQSRYSGQQASSALHDSGYNSISHGSGYGGYQGIKSGQALQSGSLQAAENVHDAGYSSGAYGASSSHSSGHSSQSGYQSRTYGAANANQFDSHSAYGSNPQQRIIYTTPVRVYGRPGSRVAIPVGVQTYDATHSASTLGQQAYNSQAEVLYNPDQHVSYKPSTDAKHYESAYSYRKKWENHDTQPEGFGTAIPTTEGPFPEKSELYEDAQTSSHQQQASLASGYNSQRGHASSMHNAYNADVQSSSASQMQQSAASSQHTGSSSLTHGAYTGDSADTTNILNGIDTKPKSYQSSYSYHKSWERQGDPYVIKPVGEAHTSLDSQRLTAASKTHGYSSRQTHQGYQSSNGLEDCDCDVNGFRRVARSIRNQQPTEDLSQQSQTSWSNLEDLRQHSQRSADLRQTHTHRQAQVQQEDENDLGQQVQQHQWGNLEDLGQHAQSSWDRPADLRQTHAHRQAQVQQQDEKDLGQQVQQHQWGNLQDLGQHAQSSWDRPADLRQTHAHRQAQVQQQDEKDLGQQVQQHQWGNLEDLGQHAQSSWDRPADLRQTHAHRQAQVQQQDEKDLGQQVQQHQWGNLEDLGQHAQSSWDRPADLRQKYAHQQASVQQQGEDFGQQVQRQRNSDQDILNEWPGYISESNTFENQEQQSSHFKPTSPSSLVIKHEHVPEDQQETTQIVSSNFNQNQQETSNTWLNQDQQQSSNTWLNQDQQQSSNTWLNQDQQQSSNTRLNQDQQESSNTWLNQDQQQSSNTRLNQDQQQSSNTWLNQDQQESSNTWLNQDQQQSSNTWLNQDQQQSSNTRLNQDQQQSSNTRLNQDQQQSSNTRLNQDQQQSFNTWLNQDQQQSSNKRLNQDQQQSSNTWLNQDQQEFHTRTFGKETSQKVDFEGLDQIYKSHHKDMEQQSNNPWGKGYADQHKNSDQWKATTMPSSWFSEQSNSYYNRQNQSDRGFSGAYNWSQTVDKSSVGSAPISSLWDKISEVDGAFFDINVQKLGKEHEKVDLTFNQDQYHGSQLGILSVSTTIKPDNHTTIIYMDNSTKKSETVVQDVGRGDIGPEENFGEQEADTKLNTSKESRPGPIANQGKDGSDSSFNETERENSSWGTQYYYSGSSYKNQSSQLNKTSEQSQENASSENQHRLIQSESSSLNLGQQKYNVDKVELEQINQDIYKNWQQAENDTQTVWGQSLESFMHIPQQDTAETFGVRIKDKDKYQEHTVATLLAESFKRESVEELGENQQQEQVPEKFKSSETSHNIKDTQTPQNTVNIEVPIETSTSKPGFWKNAKNKFVSWFKSS